MYITWQSIITAGAVLSAVLAIGVVLLKIIRWIDRQKQQDKEIKEIKSELCLLTKSILACLQGLKELGCNGPVTKAVNELETHINNKAHDMEGK